MTRKPSMSGPRLDRLRGATVPSFPTVSTDLARLVGADRAIRNEQRTRPCRRRQAHVSEHAGREEILSGCGRPLAPGWSRISALMPVVGEVDHAVPAIIGLVLQADFDVGWAAPPAAPRSR